jgi:hypothetical protein
MLSLMKSEWRKVLSTKLLWILLASSIALNALTVAIYTLVAPETTPELSGLDPLMDTGYMTTILAAAGGASVFVLIIGIIGMTGEYRHMTITSTFLATPRRGRVLVGKGATFAVIGAAFAVVNVLAVLVLTMLALIGKEHAPITAGMAGTVLLGVTLGLALYAVVGVSVGALLKNQVAAIVIAIVWVLLVEPLLVLLVSGVGKWLPGGALNAAMNVSIDADLTSADVLPVWGGAAMLVAYAAVFATLASVTTIRRDIT